MSNFNVNHPPGGPYNPQTLYGWLVQGIQSLWRRVNGISNSGSGSGNATELQGIPISPTDPVTTQILRYDGINWNPNWVNVGDLIQSSVPYGVFYADVNGTLQQVPNAVSAGMPFVSSLSAPPQFISILSIVNGGTGLNMSATGGTGQYLKQSSIGAPITVSTIPFTDGVNVGTSTVLTSGTTSVPMTTSVITLTAGGNSTFNASGGVIGQLVSFAITTTGITPFTITWQTNFKSQGVLVTGSTGGKVFVVTFRCIDGTNWYETGRTTAM